MTRNATISLLQLPAYSIEDAEASLAHTLGRIDEAAAVRPDLMVLPEVTYPAYFMGSGDLSGAQIPAPSEALSLIAAKARAYACYIAAGIAVEVDGGYENGAVLIGRDGVVAGTYAKSFLWHFDRKWFRAGGRYPVFETDFGRIGMLICADGRVPEIARSLALNGAQLIVDVTAWVSSGRHTADLTSTQAEYLLRCRAAENGVWVVAADKWGVEAESIVYCGRSCVVDPRGERVAELGPDEDKTLTYAVPIVDPAPPVLRRPELYATLTQPTESLPVVRAQAESIVVAEQDHRVAAVQMALPSDGDAFLAAAAGHIERLALQDAELVLLPATPSRSRVAYAHDRVLAGVSALAKRHGVCVGFTVWERDGEGRRALYLVGPRGVIGKHYQTHKPPGARFETMPLGDEPAAVLHTPIGRVGLMLAAEGFVPEVARSLMLRGAEILLWAGDDPAGAMLPFAQTRAEENQVFVVCAAAPTATGATAIVAPSGRALAVALEGRTLAVAADVNRALSQIKRRAPGTDVVRDRQPATYEAIVRKQGVVEGVV
ncbi:MAG TPA: carbon-nitrogen hydrolase family protein [Dehalococcoidia bacterium]|nr:carbon-nitrogen hydrolase family protein [Dehalococcoidia bacterium]